MPYDISKFTVPPTLNAVINAKNYTISSYAALNNLSSIKQALAMLRPVIIGMDVYESFESDIVAKTGKIPMPLDSEECLGGHSVLVVGYIDAPKTFKTTKGCSKK